MLNNNTTGLDPFVRLGLNLKTGVKTRNYSHPAFKVFDFTPNEHAAILAPVSLSEPSELGKVFIIQVGCGGTGSHILPNILQIIESHRLSKPNFQYDLLLIDGDTVEEKNLSRQRFSAADVGKNKAQALAERYSSVFGRPILSYPGYLGKELLPDILRGTLSTRKYNSVLFVGCVDNHYARFLISQHAYYLASSYKVFSIDMGNETYGGQAIFSRYGYYPTRPTGIGGSHKSVFSINSIQFPDFFLRFPNELIKIGRKEKRSCVDMIEENPQTMQANLLAAQCGSNLFSQFLANKMYTAILNFDARTGSVSPEMFTKPQLLKNMYTYKENLKTLQGFFLSLPFSKTISSNNLYSSTSNMNILDKYYLTGLEIYQ